MEKRNIYRISFIIIISIFIIICTTYSFAQEKRGSTTMIQDSDKDNDGRISKKEYPGPANAFNWFDKNKNGYIDKNEVSPLWHSAAHFIIIFDSDMDGKVSQKELSKSALGIPQNFKRLDLNGDSYIGLIEAPPSGPPSRNFAALIQKFDVDRDGKVSKDEISGFPRYLNLAFHPNDKNGDGYIVESEFIPVSSGKGKKGGSKK